MKSFVEKFAKNVLSKDEMKSLKGGNPADKWDDDGQGGSIIGGCSIYCGYTAWYDTSPYPTEITGYGLCGKNTVAECKKSFTTGGGYSSFKIRGCWSVGCPS